MKKSLLCFWGILLSIATLWGQRAFPFNRISTEEGIGLASNVVYCTYQDKKGFIWVGTANGLQRFDGSKFIQLGASRTGRSLMGTSLTQIIPEDSSHLWLNFQDQPEFGLFNTTTFQYTPFPYKTKRPLLNRKEFKLWKDSRGEVFISINTYGILHFNKKTKTFEDDNYFRFPDGMNPVLGLFEDTLRKQFWFPCLNKGLAVYDAVKKQLYTRDFNPTRIPLLSNSTLLSGTSEVYIDGQRRHWVFNWDRGVHRKRCFDSSGKELSDTAGLSFNPDYHEARHFFKSSRDVLWIYGLNALYNFDNTEKNFYYYDHGPGSATGIEFHFVYHMMEDHDGSIWLSTDNGLYFTSAESGTFGVLDMLLDKREGGLEITDIAELSSGEIWLTTWGKGIYSFSDKFTKTRNHLYDHMPAMTREDWVKYRQTWSIYQHKDGKVWIGCQGGKYLLHDPRSGKTQFLTDTVFGNSTIRFVTGDPTGNVWFGTFNGRLIKYDGKRFTLVQQLVSVIHKIFIDKEGLLWVCPENNGLFCLSPDGRKILHHYTNRDSGYALFQNSGSDIEQLNDSTIVFGAGAMNFINKHTKKVSWLGFENGLPGNTIQRIRIDAAGYLWMVTLDGLCRYNPVTKRVTPYGSKDGITIAHLTTQADYFSKMGLLLFAGNNALLVFQPDIFRNKAPRDVVITDFRLFNKYLSVDSLQALRRVALKNNQNSFSIYFSVLSYLNKEKLTYYYNMSGINSTWQKADRQTIVNYTLLPPGNYTFQVYSEDIDGNRSAHITTLAIYIQPPFWRTYWFISLLVLLGAAIIYFVHSVRVKRLLALEKLRNNVARDLHDDMGSTLSTINILSSMAKSKVADDPVKTTEYLGKISDNSQRMMEAMDDIVWSIKPSNDSMQKITARMREFATNVLEAKDIELGFRIDAAVLETSLPMECRRDFFLVFKEAVNNAAKYSKGKQVAIHLTLHNKRLLLLVEDDGIGFTVAPGETGNGLGNMQKRAEAMQGRLQIISKPGVGTRITLNIPVR